MRRALFAMVVVLGFSTSARADRGALTLDLGGGASLLLLPTPYASDASPLPTTVWLARVGIRYALSDEFELALSGFFEPEVTAYHHGVTIDTSRPDFPGPDAGRGAFRGTLRHQLQHVGAAVGARYIWGAIFRWHAGADLGWSLRSYSAFEHIDTSGGGARPFGLRLDDFRASNVMLAPVFGFEWAFHDKWSVSVMPRVEFLMGPDPMVAFSFPILLSTAWYI